jgi:hypothetical protein
MKILKLAALVLGFTSLFFLLSQFDPGGDWSVVFRPSAHMLMEGQNPYDEHRFLSPPWVFLVLLPLSLLTPSQGGALFALIGVGGYLFAFYRLKVKPTTLVFLVANPAFLAALFNPNFDWAVALGYTLPPQIGLFFVLTKPHMSAPLVLFWLIEAWRSGGVRQVARVFAPVLLTYGISVIFFGPWFFNMGGAIDFLSNTANVWPYGLLVGVALLAASLRQQKINYSMMQARFSRPTWLPIPGFPQYSAFSLTT